MSEGRTVVLGLGNPLMGDDGLGLAALARLQEQWEVPGFEFVDGGTWGMNLLPLVEESRHLLLLDAIRSGDPPGTLVKWERDQVPRYLSLKLSPHQIDPPRSTRAGRVARHDAGGGEPPREQSSRFSTVKAVLANRDQTRR